MAGAGSGAVDFCAATASASYGAPEPCRCLVASGPVVLPTLRSSSDAILCSLSTMLVSPSSVALGLLNNSAETAASRQHALSRQSGPREYADGLARWQRVAALAPRELPSRDAPLSRWSSSVRQRSESSVACLAFVYLATTGFYSMCRYEL